MDDLTGEFVAETRETLERIGDALLSWETHPADSARLDEIFRFVHTVKGSCGFIALPRIEALAHAAETELADVRAGGRQADAALVGAMLAVIDRIAVLVAALERPGGAVPEISSDTALIAALDRNAVAPTVIGVEAPGAAPQRNVRIAVSLLEALMTQVSDLVLVRNELARTVRLSDDPALASGFERLAGIVTDLRDSVTRTRMQPIDRLFATLPRLVRDTAKECGKLVTLELSGQDVEIDREMVEAIRDPLVHIVRNAIDHGIETPEGRVAAGKPATSVVRIAALQSGNQVSIEISDDGRGIDTGVLVQRAVAARKIDAARAAVLDPAAATQLIFEAGLSTAEKVTTISGRGVGMDVVRANVERLGGSVALVNRPGLGLTVTLRAPLTLSIVNALVVRAGGQGFAVPRGAVEEVVALGRDNARIEAVGRGHIAVIRGVAHPAYILADLLGLRAQDSRLAMIVATPSGGRYVLAVEAVLDHEELVVRPMAPQLVSQGMFAGQSLGDDGRPVIVLDPVGIAGAIGLARDTRAVEPAATVVTARPASVVVATALDGRRVAVRSLLVERLVETSRADWVEAGGWWFAIVEGRHLPSCWSGDMPDNASILAMLLFDGQRRVVLPVATVHDLAPLVEMAVVDAKGVEALLNIGDLPVELLDALSLFERATDIAAKRPVAAILLDRTPWSQAILAPLVAAAGYEVHFGAADAPELVIHLDGDDVPSNAALRIPLERQAEGGVAIDRYDGPALRTLIGATRRKSA
ncbi:chemotaxis protein CheA [Sphingomonas sp. SUN039]|uniref:chemotaxis protein CheA n=1 Tax=Sphingomonas sp. SUN039 TaxID=2937787 RepID=UPI00216424DF|nr:ATP-binding protein [Sphingomonas sp. SUN039]UVO53846.1 Hpt domain-containing protein [Sphingomonas sp. SUN039]